MLIIRQHNMQTEADGLLNHCPNRQKRKNHVSVRLFIKPV